MKIHTDTSVIYNLINTNYLLEELKNLGVTINYLNVFEILKTNPNNKLKRVICAYKNSTPFLDNIISNTSIIECIEADHGSKFIDPNNLEWVENFRQIANSSKLNKISFSGDDFIYNKKHYNQFTYPYKLSVETWNNLFIDLRKKEKKLTENDIFQIFNYRVKKDIGKELSEKEFFNRELFLNVFIDFANEIIFNTTNENKKRNKMKSNDFIDLIIMLYVKKGELYWTCETEWNERIKKLFPTGEYQFNGEKYLLKPYRK